MDLMPSCKLLFTNCLFISKLIHLLPHVVTKKAMTIITIKIAYYLFLFTLTKF